MSEKEIRYWKKVSENDLPYVVGELRDVVKRPSLIILSGDMGTGKTTFAKAFASDGELQSPTYSVITETPTVAHADFYRIENPTEIIHLELGLYLENKDFFLVEWGKKYFDEILKEVDEHFSVYELNIEINKSSANNLRDYFLNQID